MIPSIIIPAYNPPVTFPNLLQSIRNITSIPIIIVDDGSNSGIEIDPVYKNIKLLKNQINNGKGFSLIKGFHYAYDQGYTHCITLDADSQHDPSLIPNFLLIDESVSVACGRRAFKRPMPFKRMLSNIITSKIISLICHTKVYDSQCGYRCYRVRDICKEKFEENGFQFETEVLIKHLRKGLRLSHIEIPTIYSNEGSAMQHFHDTLKFINLIIRTLRKL